MLHDAHNHLQDEALAPHLHEITTAWPALAGASGRIVVNGTHPSDWPRVATLAATYSFLRPAYGIHPWDSGTPRPDDWLDQLEQHLTANPFATVGEIGLDRWILDSARPDDPRLAGVPRAPMALQIATFLPQLALAVSHNRAATIHCLQAFGELLPLLRAHPRPARGFLLHAYGGPAELVPELVALGAYFSFNPAFLDPRKATRQETFKHIPPDRLLCETDAPAMLPPQTWRTHKLPPAADGSPVNHPGNIEAAYAGLAALRGMDVSTLSIRISENFTRLFGAP
jgi:TatD DNase family protein